jgi:hypothetical protein
VLVENLTSRDFRPNPEWYHLLDGPTLIGIWRTHSPTLRAPE